MPLIVFEELFRFNANFEPWNQSNYLVFQFNAYMLFLISNVMNVFPAEFYNEKFWKTLPNLFVAPLNQFYILLGIFFGHLIVNSIPFSVVFILCYIYYPISLASVIFVLFIYFLIALIFSGVGLIIGVFAISNENLTGPLNFISTAFLWLSCITYPFQIFPDFFHFFINLNPLYYIFSFLRLSWIHDNILFTIASNYQNLLVLIGSSIFLPIIGILLFKYVFKRYGIVGY